jgi:hypothetical protein
VHSTFAFREEEQEMSCAETLVSGKARPVDDAAPQTIAINWRDTEFVEISVLSQERNIVFFLNENAFIEGEGAAYLRDS